MSHEEDGLQAALFQCRRWLDLATMALDRQCAVIARARTGPVSREDVMKVAGAGGDLDECLGAIFALLERRPLVDLLLRKSTMRVAAMRGLLVARRARLLLALETDQPERVLVDLAHGTAALREDLRVLAEGLPPQQVGVLLSPRRMLGASAGTYRQGTEEDLDQGAPAKRRS